MPAILGVAVIMCESTDNFSVANTSHPLRAAWEFLFGPVTNTAWDTIHHHIRKTGHFTGYGLLSALFFAPGTSPCDLCDPSKKWRHRRGC
jgi:hypothetical protein